MSAQSHLLPLTSAGLPLYQSELASLADEALVVTMTQVNNLYAGLRLYRGTHGSVKRVSIFSPLTSVEWLHLVLSESIYTPRFIPHLNVIKIFFIHFELKLTTFLLCYSLNSKLITYTNDKVKTCFLEMFAKSCLQYHFTEFGNTYKRTHNRVYGVEWFADVNVVNRVPHSGGGVMVWAGISYRQRTQLHFIDGNLNAHRYRDEILRPIVVPFICRHHLMFQHDNTQPLEAENVPVLPWPAHSPDMSPIEHVWDALDQRVCLFQSPAISSNFAQPLKRSGTTFHRPLSTQIKLANLCSLGEDCCYFGIKETDCLKSSGEEPQMSVGFFVPATSCTTRVRATAELTRCGRNSSESSSEENFTRQRLNVPFGNRGPALPVPGSEAPLFPSHSFSRQEGPQLIPRGDSIGNHLEYIQ
ncbi:LOW QUALITY PROTEIN: secreted phosphoprotein 24 [Salvelinus alpinus]